MENFKNNPGKNPDKGKTSLSNKKKLLLYGTIGSSLLLAFIAKRYHTSIANQWLVRTGWMIKDMEIGKRFIRWPFQNIQYVDLSPETFKFTINAMSKEKMQFNSHQYLLSVQKTTKLN